MSKKQLMSLTITLIFFLFTNYAFANNRYGVANFDNDKTVEIFANKFREAIINKDEQKVASMVLYPIEATLKNKTVIINNKKEFLKVYDDIFDKDLCDKIAKDSTHNLFANYQGVMLGDGEVWFGNENGNVKVVAVGVCRRYYPENSK